MTRSIASFAEGSWFEGKGDARQVFHAVTGEVLGTVSSGGLDFQGMLDYARNIGGPQLRKMTFHERALMLKRLAVYLNERKEEFYTVSAATGATKKDSWIDIEGGIGTVFTYASKGRRELPNEPFLLEGNQEAISKLGSFTGHHICVPLEGVAIHINAFNFPCWGMLEKLAPSILAGVPTIIKPATITCFLTEKMVRAIAASEILPEGALQLICGGTGDLLDRVGCQDVVTFTGSARTGLKLKTTPAIVQNAVRFNMEADSLNFSMLGPDAKPGTEEFDLYIKEVVRETTVKAGQKCTAIRRAIVPDNMIDDVVKALSKRFGEVKLGDPAVEGVRMGPLAAREQVNEVKERVREIASVSEIVYGNLDNFDVTGGDKQRGAFFPAMLLYCKNSNADAPHNIEAFGPVTTVIGYKNVQEAVALTKRAQGSLVGSLFTADDKVAREVVLGSASHHGRIMVVNKECAPESTGHGSPMPHLVHGGPGRAGGGEELGGMRAVHHYMQRTAVQGSPTTLTRISGQWLKGAARKEDKVHPFRKYFDELEIGETLITKKRTVTNDDVLDFAKISGDYFYAHMDDEAAAKNDLFKKRVAHGYFVLSAAAGLFVDPAPGPVLANYGLENLRFTQPVYIGDSIYVKFTCKQKTAKEKRDGQVPQGVVHWDVEVFNQNEEMVAFYTILTLVARKN